MRAARRRSRVIGAGRPVRRADGVPGVGGGGIVGSVEADPSQLTGLAGWVVDAVELLGPVGVGLLVALETVFPPIPSEVVLPVSGFLAGQGRMSVVLAVVGATAGSLAGALVLYWVAAAIGMRRLHVVVDKVPLVEHEDLDAAERWFERHGAVAVLTGRVIPVVRSLVSIPAGVARMRMVVFLGFTALGSGVYNSALIGLGYALGDRWTDVGRWSDVINAVIIGVIVLLLGTAVVRRLRSNRRERGAGDRTRRDSERR